MKSQQSRRWHRRNVPSQPVGNPLMKTLFAIPLLLASTTLHAREIPISTPAELKSALDSAQPNDTLILKNAIWSDPPIIITKGGDPNHPLTLKSQTPGKVLFTGKSAVDIKAPYVIL